MPTFNCKGYYWVAFKGSPHVYKLYKVILKAEKELRIRSIHQEDNVADNVKGWYKREDVLDIKYIGESFPERVCPDKEGFYWITSRDGTRHIVQIYLADRGHIYQKYKAIAVGNASHYSWLSMMEKYEVMRIDFIATADPDYYINR